MTDPGLTQEGFGDSLNLLSTATMVVSALGVMQSAAASQSEALLNSVRHNNQAATVELATTAASAMNILNGDTNPPDANGKHTKKILRLLQVRMNQNAGAPVVT
jgi:hypothetical protein